MAPTAFALLGFALDLVAMAHRATINRRRAALFATAVIVTAAANVAVLVRVDDGTT
jgi:hypothetical protein